MSRAGVGGVLAVLVAACSAPPADFVVNVDEGGGGSPTLGLDDVYVVEEGETLDLLVTASVGGGTVVADGLPANAEMVDGIFTFRPGFDQAGVYRVDFTATVDGVGVARSIAVRVRNVIHVVPPTPAAVDEGGTTSVTIRSTDPVGTVVRYRSSLDTSPIPGASLDATTGVLTFAPAYDHLDFFPNPTIITVSAEGTEVDTGEPRTSTAEIAFPIAEKTAYEQEVQTGIFNVSCAFAGGCHGGSAPSAGLNLSTGLSYDAIIGITPAGPACSGGVATETAQVVVGEPDESLLYHKMTGEQSCGRRMPINCDSGGSLPCTTDAANRKVRLWIEDGAPRN